MADRVKRANPDRSNISFVAKIDTERAEDALT
jgi:hypothetical protein